MATPPESRRGATRPPSGEGPATVRHPVDQGTGERDLRQNASSETRTAVSERPTQMPEDGVQERPTVAPNFDFEEFARNSADSKRPHQVPKADDSGIVEIHGPTHLDLEQSYEAELGSLGRVPVVRMSGGELRGINLEPAAGFLLSNMDGISTLEMLLDLGGMPRVEALRIICQLVRDHIVELA